jgi:dGTPase
MYLLRQRMEEIEADTSARYALLSRESRGRKHHEHEPKYRTAFQRDRDRIVHSAAFRRLEYKTQVFVNDEGDYYRTRLTHTLEVSQIGRTMARALQVNEDLVESVCLAHDLGHPPFGHAGEGCLNELIRDEGGFNHNHQSYRVVTELEQRYTNWDGLNLTFETLEGLAKHETQYDLSVLAGLDQALRGSIEAQIANIADELAYNAHDLDDGLQAGLITPQQLQTLELWQMLCERLNHTSDTLSELDRHRFIRELVGMQVDDVLTCSAQALFELNPSTPLDVQKHTSNVVQHSAKFQLLNRQLKTFLYQNMYYQFRVVRMAQRAERFISEIFRSYVKEPRQLPTEYQAKLQTMATGRVVVDYIASMTDRGAMLEYRRLFDPLMRP